VNVIPTESADEQIKNVADEIERLRDRENWEYEDFAVALKQSGSAVIETLRAFQQTGVPTESSTVTGSAMIPLFESYCRLFVIWQPMMTMLKQSCWKPRF